MSAKYQMQFNRMRQAAITNERASRSSFPLLVRLSSLTPALLSPAVVDIITGASAR